MKKQYPSGEDQDCRKRSCAMCEVTKRNFAGSCPLSRIPDKKKKVPCVKKEGEISGKPLFLFLFSPLDFTWPAQGMDPAMCSRYCDGKQVSKIKFREFTGKAYWMSNKREDFPDEKRNGRKNFKVINRVNHEK